MFGFGKKLMPFAASDVSLDLDQANVPLSARAQALQDQVTAEFEQEWTKNEQIATKRVMGDISTLPSDSQALEINQITYALCADQREISQIANGLAFATIDQHTRVAQGLVDVKNAVDRSAVAANALDFAIEHPFLTGFLGTAVIEKLSRK